MNRRSFLKIVGTLSLVDIAGMRQLAGFASQGEKSNGGKRSDKPDVLVILTDDHNARCMGYADDPNVKTPHIDKLAHEGIIFDNCYSTSTVCMPSRCSLISGLYPHNIHLWGNSTDFYMLPHLAPMFRDIKNAGLTTAQIGKQHWQGGGAFKRHFETAAEFYKALGLDYAVHIASPFESRSGSGPYRDFLRQKGLLNKYVQDINERLTNDQFKVRQSIMPPELHNDSFIADKAIEFIKNQPEEQPYCLVVGFSAPHTPLDASGKYATMYDPEEIELPANVPEKLCHNGETIDHSVIKKMRASYFGKITMMDDNVGRIIEQTKKRGRWDNTLVIFTADQGLELGAHGNLSKGWFFEESIKAPLMMRWPKKIPSEQRTKALCQLFDIYPTIVEAIGGNLTEDGHFARSLLTLATGKTDKIRNVVFSEFSSGSEELDYMVRTERYKWFIQKGNEYLFDLQKDPYETENIIDYPQNANLAKSMRHKYCEFMLDTQYNYSEYYVPLFQRKRKEEIKN